MTHKYQTLFGDLYYIKLCLLTQIEDLQLSLSRMEKESGRREDLLRQEISDLHQVNPMALLIFLLLHAISNPGQPHGSIDPVTLVCNILSRSTVNPTALSILLLLYAISYSGQSHGSIDPLTLVRNILSRSTPRLY